MVECRGPRQKPVCPCAAAEGVVVAQRSWRRCDNSVQTEFERRSGPELEHRAVSAVRTTRMGQAWVASSAQEASSPPNVRRGAISAISFSI